MDDALTGDAQTGGTQTSDSLGSPAAKANASSERRSERGSAEQSGFDSLLAALAPDRAEAAMRYTALRERLSRFFAWNHAADPDTLSDETLDRLTRRIASSSAAKEIPGAENDDAVRQPEKFAAGIARMLLREQWRGQKADARMLDALEKKAGTARQEQEERARVEALTLVMDDCLAQLAPEQRDLIARYYSTESRNQMDGRKRLAEEFRISLNALRNRAMRIRADVERCARSKLEEGSL